MKALTRSDLLDLERYETEREAYRERIVAYKRIRRVAVGDRLTLLFENRETIRFQVQEMLRVERTHSAEGAQRELDVYNELVPAAGYLSGTLMIEITEAPAIRPELDRLIGIDECVALRLGAGSRGMHEIRARFDERQVSAERISAVHYLRFAVDEEARELLADTAVPARLAVDHANYRAATTLSAALRQSLLDDLADATPPLLDVATLPSRDPDRAGANGFAQGAPPGGDRFRIFRPREPAGPGHVVVESTAPLRSWLDADAALWAALRGVLQHLGNDIRARHGACRCAMDSEDAGGRGRWHLFAPSDPLS